MRLKSSINDWWRGGNIWSAHLSCCLFSSLHQFTALLSRSSIMTDSQCIMILFRSETKSQSWKRFPWVIKISLLWSTISKLWTTVSKAEGRSYVCLVILIDLISVFGDRSGSWWRAVRSDLSQGIVLWIGRCRSNKSNIIGRSIFARAWYCSSRWARMESITTDRYRSDWLYEQTWNQKTYYLERQRTMQTS